MSLDELRLGRYQVVSGEESKAKIISMLKADDIGRLALFDEEYPYVIPMNHVFYEEEGVLILHGSFEGKKTTLMERNRRAAYEVDYCVEDVEEKKRSCHLLYESVIIYGEISPVDSRDERRRYMQIMMSEYGFGPLGHGQEDRCHAFIFRIHKGSARDGRFRPTEDNTIYLYDFKNSR